MPEEISLEAYRKLVKAPAKPVYAATEAEEQSAYFDWIANVTPREPRLRWARHWPNGEYRTKATAAKLQRMGVASGPLDVWLFVPSQGHCGLVLEFKTAKGTTSTEQDEWIAHLAQSGWYVAVPRSWIVAARITLWYLGYPESRYAHFGSALVLLEGQPHEK